MPEKKRTKNIIKKLNNKLTHCFADFKGIYFYGSRAKNTHSEDSDIDIVAIFDKIDREKRMEIWGIVGQIESEYNAFIDLHPMTKEELELNPFYYEQVVGNGIFYEAA